jgi:hypothetical protein
MLFHKFKNFLRLAPLYPDPHSFAEAVGVRCLVPILPTPPPRFAEAAGGRGFPPGAEYPIGLEASAPRSGGGAAGDVRGGEKKLRTFLNNLK